MASICIKKLDQNSLGPLLWLHKDAVTELKKRKHKLTTHTKQMTQVTNLKKKFINY